MESKSIIIHSDIKDHIDLLSDEEAGQLFKAIIAYAECGTVFSTDNRVLNMAFSFIKSQIDKDVAKYEEKCRKNREIGKLGGRPRKNQTDSIKTERLNKKPNGLFDNQMVSEKPYPNPIPNPIPNPNNNPKENNSKAKRFIKPTLQEIEQCIKEKGYNIEAGAFYDYYEANGWVQGQGKPIKNWKAALSTWNRRSGQFVGGFQSSKHEKMDSLSNDGTFKTTL